MTYSETFWKYVRYSCVGAALLFLGLFLFGVTKDANAQECQSPAVVGAKLQGMMPGVLVKDSVPHPNGTGATIVVYEHPGVPSLYLLVTFVDGCMVHMEEVPKPLVDAYIESLPNA